MDLSYSSDGFGRSTPPGYENRRRIAASDSNDGVSDGSEFVMENDLSYAGAPPSRGPLLPPGLHPPGLPALVPRVQRVVPDDEFVVPNMLAASQAPLPRVVRSTDGDISSGGWTDEDEKEQTLNESFNARSVPAPSPLMPVPAARIVKEKFVNISDLSNGVSNSPHASPVPATSSLGQPPSDPSPVAARRLSKVNSPAIQQVDVKQLDALNASFVSLYQDVSRNISNTPPSRPEPFAIHQDTTPAVPPLAEYVSPNTSVSVPQKITSRFSAPCLPDDPLNAAVHNPLIAKAKEIMSKSATAARMEKAAVPNILDKIKNNFPSPDSMADISMLSRELRALVDNCPQLFVVECEEPDQMTVRLRCPPTAELLAAKSVRQAVEDDFAWMDPANCIIPLDVSQFVCVAAMYFIPPRGILFASFWGNDRAERFRHVQDLIEPFVPILKPVERFIPGMPCVVREGGDYARAVVVDKAEAGMVKVICLDNYAFVCSSPADIFYLPDELDTNHIKCSLFLGRIHGIRSVPLKVQESLTGMIDEMMTSLMCTAGVLFPAKGSDRLCSCDIVLQGTEVWLSSEMLEKFGAEKMPDEPVIDAAHTNNKVIEQYGNGYYDFNKAMITLKGAPGMVQPTMEDNKDEEKNVTQEDQKDSSPDFDDLAKEMQNEGGANSTDDTLNNHTEEECLLGSAVIAEPLVQENPQQIDIGQTPGLVPHLSNYSAFVDYMVADAANHTIKMCVIHNAISHVMFLKMNYDPNNEDAKALDELIARLKQMA